MVFNQKAKPIEPDRNRFESGRKRKLPAFLRPKGGVRMTYGYVRVSTKEQHTDRQVDALREYGVDRLFIDRQSGKNFSRSNYQLLLELAKEGDLIIVKSIDRLGRNYEEILEQWRLITKSKRVDIVILDIPLLDTRTKERDITGTLVADLVLQILAYVAQTEREFNRQRQAEGIAAAKARGVRFGRRPKERGSGYESIYRKWKEGEISGREAARRLEVSHGTFQRWVREQK